MSYRASEIEWQTIRTFGQWWGIVDKRKYRDLLRE
jgi:hypothetical protein